MIRAVLCRQRRPVTSIAWPFLASICSSSLAALGAALAALQNIGTAADDQQPSKLALRPSDEIPPSRSCRLSSAVLGVSPKPGCKNRGPWQTFRPVGPAPASAVAVIGPRPRSQSIHGAAHLPGHVLGDLSCRAALPDRSTARAAPSFTRNIARAASDSDAPISSPSSSRLASTLM